VFTSVKLASRGAMMDAWDLGSRIKPSGDMIQDLFNQAAYMAHGYCLLWNPWLVALHAGSDVLVATAYFAIPLAIFQFQRLKGAWDLSHLAWLFFAFITFCGLTHLFSALTLWFPVYELQAYVKLATAFVSIATAVVMFPLVPAVAAMPTPRELQKANERLAREVAAHRETLAELEAARRDLMARVEERTRALALAKERFEALVMGSSQAAWTMSPAGVALEDSPSWRRATGQTVDGWLGRGWLDAVHPEDRSHLLAQWQQARTTKAVCAAEYRLQSADGSWVWSSARAVPLLDAEGEIREWVGMNVDISERKRAEELRLATMRELSHRTKNLLAVIGAMARQSVHPGQSTADYVAQFGARLHGLARSHDLLVQRDWSGVHLGELVKAQLAGFTDAEGHVIAGPDVDLSPPATQAIGMALFELATNAAKYGALAASGGRLAVTWRTVGAPDQPALELLWHEEPSLAVELPQQQGFGYVVVTRTVRDALDAEVEYGITAARITWRMTAPLAAIRTQAS